MISVKYMLTIFFSIWSMQIFFSPMTLQLGVDAQRQSQYSWKTGTWGQCVSQECGSSGLQSRPVWCVHSEGWSTHQSNCAPSVRPHSQRACVKMCEWQQELFEWQPSAWGPCIPSPSFSAKQCVTAQRGLQKRNVTCVWRSNGTAVSPHLCEAFTPAPSMEQACLLPCPLDCVVSDFSHWSACSRSCGPALQQRTRQVLAPPLYGGSNCPNLTQIRNCNHNNSVCPSDQQEFSYSLWAGPWSDCRLKGMLPSGRTTVDFSAGLSGKTAVKHSYTVKRHTERFHHLHHNHHHHYHHHHFHHYHHNDNHKDSKASWDIQVGYQTRQLRCMRSDGRNAMLSLCDPDNRPVNFRSCVMPRDCEVSDWSPWSQCSKTCHTADLSPGYRTRKRVLRRTPIGGGKPCPALEEKETCNASGHPLPPCPRFEWMVTSWSSCLADPLLNQQNRRHGNSSFLCGGGIQTREAYCVHTDANTAPSHMGRPVERSFCSRPLPLLVQRCSISCPSYCLFSPWSEWGPCLHDICLKPQGAKGFRFRTRSIIGESWSESENCNHVTESMPCDDPVCLMWRLTPQGPCIPQEGACGPGTQEQNAECVTVTGEAVPAKQCPEDPPPVKQPCVVPCPGDCVLEDWGPWSPCSHSCSNKHSKGRQGRTRSVLALPTQGRKTCPSASALEQWRPCATHPCVVFYWDASPWGPCTPNPLSDSDNTTNQWDTETICGNGTQTRQVTCRRVDNGQVAPKRCPESTRPVFTRSCPVPCKTDCIVTPFSEWSPCPSKCSPGNTTLATQSRYRIIVQRSANGGQECPDTLYEERECEPPLPCPTYRWQAHSWRSCILVPDSVRQAVGGPAEACGLGLEIRDVACVGVDDVHVEITECLQWAGVMPAQVRSCQVMCRDDCTLSPWSRFSQCQGCGSWRTRTRTLIGHSKRRSHCHQESLFPLVEKEICPCSEYKVQPYGDWSPCLLPEAHDWNSFSLGQGGLQWDQRAAHLWRVQWSRRECGQGLRYRAIACLDHQGLLVDPAHCSTTGYEEEVCHVPCPLDCRLSEWSVWSPCSAPCGGGVKVRSQWLREKPFNGGSPCPKLNFKNQAQVSEVLPCHTECSQHVWETEPWSTCTIHSSNMPGADEKQPACGDGVQTRKVRCIKRTGENQGENVAESLCRQEEPPITTQSCLIPCPAHCVTTHWSQWSLCPVSCDQSMLRWRTRSVLRLPENGHTCPELNQTQPCTLNSTCLTYTYTYSDWSTCQISENAVCGPGIKTRLLNCVRSDGRLVELSMCKEWGPSRGKLQVPCEVICSVNCLLSAWSPWSPCSHTCGSQSQMIRSRVVLQEAGEGGRPCPSQLSQTKPCPITPCYSWLLGNWSPCRVEGAECGEGMRERNVTCVVHWGSLSDERSPKAVEEERCGSKSGIANESELRLPCSLPCPGDCHLTEWSTWSSCQLMCLEGRSFETLGRQARSRAVVIQVPENQNSCPSQVYETKVCKGGSCLSYEWKTGGWSDNKRTVWCQRSDGVNVTGGCSSRSRPSTVQHCQPPCSKPFSFCTQNGVCGCERGFTEVMTSHGFLDYCTRTPGSDSKKADVKKSTGHLRPRKVWHSNRVRNWPLQPLGPDGRVRLWVYGLMAAGFILILLIIAMSFLLCKNTEDNPSKSGPLKALALAYDGDVDM
ncbi:thrombospondin type-1 domain-containing protein 7B [Chanos chanos]|uniref:Thrombospondin type-1 domain-containing protein 7A n=1 Tax=Chanos chanos TaxID=29144 RepID=A0A6J2V8S9_CHACN|nr:thrombospondin type-1 domain-containing protein 7B-like [Chanos chanos]